MLLITLTLWGLTPATLQAEDKAGASSNSSGIESLALHGQFESLLETLNKQADLKTALGQNLKTELENYRKNHTRRMEANQTDFDRAMKALAENLEAGKVEDAIVEAMNARGATQDRAAFLKSEAITRLVTEAEQAAKTAEQKEHWIEATNIWAQLNLLFDMDRRYRDDLRRAARKLALIRFYAPEKFKQLFVEHEKRLGVDEAEIEEPKFSTDNWDKQVAGSDESILRDALNLAARFHVAQQGYGPAVAEGITSLLDLTDLPQLQETFPGLKDEKKLDEFRENLKTIHGVATNKGKNIGFTDMTGFLIRLEKINDETVKLPEEVLFYEFGNGAMASLDDFTNIIWPHDLEQFNRAITGDFVGVGISIEMRDGKLTVVSPLEGTPAHRAGIKSEDVIATVDGESTMGWTIDQAVRTITGPENTKVVLGIQRAGNKELIEMPIKREKIVIQSVRGWERDPKGGWNYYVDPDNKIGYIRLTQFMQQTEEEMTEAIFQMKQDKGLNGLVLDLRGNPGGLLNAAIKVCDRFMRAGHVVSIEGPYERRNQHFSASKSDLDVDVPLVILVNRGSASASEIVSGALQANGKAIVIGTRSFGKGSVQEPLPIDRGNARIKLTTQYYKIGKEGDLRIIHRKPESKAWGIEPDLEVETSDQEIIALREARSKIDILLDKDELEKVEGNPYDASEILEKGMDPQLEAAMIVLKSKLLAEQLKLAKAAKAE